MSAPQIPSPDANHPRMRRVDVTRDFLTPGQLGIIDQNNKEQFAKFRKLHPNRPTYLALFFGGIVASVYGYTMYRMSSDNLVDEIEQEILGNTEVQK